MDCQDLPTLTDFAPAITDVLPSLLRELVALTEERQEPVCGSEAALASHE